MAEIITLKILRVGLILFETITVSQHKATVYFYIADNPLEMHLTTHHYNWLKGKGVRLERFAQEHSTTTRKLLEPESRDTDFSRLASFSPLFPEICLKQFLLYVALFK